MRVTGDEVWVSFRNVETREQWKQWIHTRPPKKRKKFKQVLFSCQNAEVSWRGEGKEDSYWSSCRNDRSNVMDMLRNTKGLRKAIQNKDVEGWHLV
jgi:hypothetical protein